MELLTLLMKYGANALSYYFETVGTKNPLPRPLVEEMTFEQVELAKELVMEKIASRQANGENVRLYTLLLAIDHHPLSILLLSLVLLQQQYREVATFCSKEGIEGISLELVTDIYHGLYAREEDVPYAELKDCYYKLNQIVFAKPSPRPFYQQLFYSDRRLTDYLCGSNHFDEDLEQFAQMMFTYQRLQNLFVNQSVLEEIRSAITYSQINPYPKLQLTGEDGYGKRLLSAIACQHIDYDALFIDTKILLSCDPQNLPVLIKHICREQLFYDCAVVFHGLTTEKEGEKNCLELFLRHCMKPLERVNFPVILCTHQHIQLIPHIEGYMKKIDLAELRYSQRVQLWQGYCQQYGVLEVDAMMTASKYKLSPKEIKSTVQRLVHAIADGETVNEELLTKVCGEVLPAPSQGNIKLVNTNYTFDDLKLPREQKESILNICAHVTQRFKVYDEWGMEEKYAYGKNVSALLVGPPGTGKTMAVHVISNLLQLPLYKIDLSQVVDKYIGETEKRLEDIFTTAEKNNVILFFDEADSIFGKRSETNDAKDKYANTEVSYILQRMEQYEGIILMATNYKKNIDDAFMRRIRYLIEFQLPDCPLRKELWQSAFAEKVPLEGVDFDFLARQFEFSGGSIKNIVLNATFLAAKEGTAVTMEKILHCVKMENHKMNKTMLRQDFGEYAYYI